MREALAYGIDFGTSNSAISIAYRDGVDVVAVDAQSALVESLPSIVYLHRGGNRAAGLDAVQQFLTTGAISTKCGACELVDVFNGRTYTECKTHVTGGFCMDSRLMSGLKSFLSEEALATHSWARNFSISELVAIILANLKHQADSVTGQEIRRVVLGHPVAFEGAEGERFQQLQQHAVEQLVAAAHAAGFEEVALFPEPSAALIDESLESGIAIAVDFGGGTFDVAVIEFDGPRGDVTALQGAAIGGERFDALLFDAKVGPALAIDRGYVDNFGKEHRLPGWFRSGLRTLSGTARLLSNRMTNSTLRQFLDYKGGQALRPVDELLFGGHAYALHRSIEDAKIDLSTNQTAHIRLQRPGIDLNVPLTETEFAQLISRDIDILQDCIERALGQADVSPDEVHHVVLTGGSSRIQAFRRMLVDLFGADRLVERHIFNTIVSGLGSEARRLWA